MTTELEHIIEKSYEIFKKYKAKAPLDACTECCLTKNQESELVSLTVRHVPFELLYDYNTAAKTEKPDIQEFKHFLPRFLELTAEFKFLHHSGELVLSRFDYYDKTDWTREEQELMQDFGQAYFRLCMTIHPLPELERVDSILIMLWKTKIDIQQILSDWTIIKTKESLLHFNDLIQRCFKDNKPNELMSPFADKELSKIIVQWLDKDTTKESFADKIEEIIMQPPTDLEERILNELSWTYDKMKIKNAPQ
jgi:hypothetical protein